MEYIFELIERYGLYVIFIIIGIEYACFPIPSEVVLPLAGAIGYVNEINPIVMILLSTLSGLIGSLFCYTLGYLGKTKMIDKITKNNKKEREESNSFYNKYSNFAILFGRLIPICRTYISFVAGASKHKIGKYLLFTTIGILLWNSILIYLGYIFYDNIEIIGPYYDKYKIIIFSILGLIIAFLIIKTIKKKKALARASKL